VEEKLTRFEDYIKQLMAHQQIQKPLALGNKVRVDLGDLLIQDHLPRPKSQFYQAEFDGVGFILKPEIPFSERRLAEIGQELKQTDFNGILMYKIDPRYVKLNGLSSLEKYLSAYATFSGLEAGFTRIDPVPDHFLGDAGDLVVTYLPNADLTRARLVSDEKFVQFLKEHPLVSSVTWNATEESLKNKRRNMSVVFSRRPALKYIEEFDARYLDLVGTHGFSTETTLVFRNPSVEALSKVEGYEDQFVTSGVYSHYLKIIIGKYGDVSISQGTEPKVDRMMRKDGSIDLTRGDYYAYYDPMSPNLRRQALSLLTIEPWKKLDSIIGPVYISGKEN